jgi:hypothetical protein
MGGSSPSTPESFDRAASTKRASLVRQQWEDYKTRFQPVENKLINEMGTGEHTTFNEAGIAMANRAADTAYSSAADMEQRDRQRLGQGLTGLQLQAQQSNNNMARSVGTATAVNQASQADIDRKNAVMSAGLGSASAIGK